MRALALALLLISAAAGALPAATYHLNAAGTGDFPTIASGIALCSPGDTLLLAAGLYLGPGNTQLDYGGKNIVIAGAGPGATILDCDDSGQAAVLFQRGETRAAVLRDLTLRNNKGSYWPTGVTILSASPTLANLYLEDFDGYWSENWPPYFRGPALHCENGSPRVEDVEVRDCNYAGGVYLIGGAPEFERVLIEACTANLTSGGGLVVAGAATFHELIVRDCLAHGGSGGGVHCADAAVFEDCRFESNWQAHELTGGWWYGGGGGFVCDGASPTLRRCVFTGNDARDGGGAIACFGGSAPALEEVLILDNGAAGGGSALLVVDSAPVLRGVTITSSRFDAMFGHEIGMPSSIYCVSGAPAMERVIVAQNLVGTGLYAEPGSTPSLACCDIVGNPGGNYGGAMIDPTGTAGNIALDPLFCGGPDPETACAIAVGSPCAPGNNECGLLIGVCPPACEIEAFRITGHIAGADGLPLAGVAIGGIAYPVNSNSAGDYAILLPAGWTGTISPSLPGYTFSPDSREYTDLDTDQPGQDFLATRVTLRRVPQDCPSIQEALNAVIDGDTVLVAPGVYAGAGFVQMSLLGKNVCVIGEAGSGETTIDCEGAGRGFDVVQGESAAALIQGFTLRNGFVSGLVAYGGGIRIINASPTLRDLVILDCAAEDGGGGISLRNSQSLVEDVAVRDCAIIGSNSSAHGGGIACYETATPTLRRVLLAGNSSPRQAGGLYCRDASPILEQVTLVGNTAQSGGGIGCDYVSLPSLSGCLVAGNTATTTGGIYCRDTGSVPTIACSDIFANPGGNYGGTLADQTGLNGNISADPLFCDAPGGDYMLDATSPCLPANNDCQVQMGAFGWGCGTTAAEESTPAAFAFAAPQPNPFNPKTTLRFALPHAAAVDLVIFDVAGRQVRHLLAGETLPAGQHAVDWDGRDEAGRALASGVYFARFAAAGFTEERKLVLLR